MPVQSDRNLKQDIAPVTWSDPVTTCARELGTTGHPVKLEVLVPRDNSDVYSLREPAPDPTLEPGPGGTTGRSDRDVKLGVTPVRW
jgi:hypothetical protein